MMEVNLYIVLLSVLFLIGLIGVTALYYLKKSQKTKLKVNIISDDMTGEHFFVKNIDEKIEHKSGTYIYDSSCVIKRSKYYEVFYNRGNPNPIKFDFKKSNVEMTSKNLKGVIETTLIKELFDGGVFSTENILIIVCMVISGISLFMIFSMFNGGVSIANNPENLQVIETAVRNVIGG